MRSVIAMTGASGAIYGIRLLQELPGEKILVMSETAEAIIPEETDYTVEQVKAMADSVYENTDLFAPIASGSFDYDILYVIPCIAVALVILAAALIARSHKKAKN